MTLIEQNAPVSNFHGDPVAWDDLKFFFIFCPNNSGTTVLAQYLAATIGGYLPPFGNNEGQMAPAVRAIMRNRPWKKDTAFDWAYIRKQWEDLASGAVFVEASPPNLIRVDEIAPVFGADSTALMSICDPYQHIASCMRRYSGRPEAVARTWVRKARAILQTMNAYPHFPFISYEAFVDNPLIVNETLGVPVRDATVEGKQGSGIDGIASGYCRGVGFLRPDEVLAITEVLAGAPKVMAHFGYALAGPHFLQDAQQRNPDEFAVGQGARRVWDQQAAAESTA